MFDARARRLLEHPLDRAAAALDVPAVTPDRLTAAGLVLGLGRRGRLMDRVGAAVAGPRLADGGDGPLAHYVNGAAFLAFSSIAERTGATIDDGRSLSFLGGLAEGGETILVHTLWLLLPFWAPQIAVVWAAVVGVSAAHRIVAGYGALR